MKTRSQIVLVFALAIQSSVLLAAPLPVEPAAGEKNPEARDATSTAAELPLAQEQVLKKYQRFEEVLLRMSELTAASDPKQFDRLVNLLKRDQLATAVTNQKDVEKDLRQLLDLLLSEQRADRLKSERERIKEQIRRINELINKQQQIEGQTQGGADLKKLAESQGKLGQQTGKLADDMKDATQQESKKDDAENDEESKEGKPDRNEGERKEGKAENGEKKEGDPKGDSSKGETPKGDQQEGDSDKLPEKGDQEKSTDKPGSPDEKDPQQGKPQQGQPQQGKPQQGRPQQDQNQPSQPQEGDQGDSPDQPPPSDSEAARRRVREAQQAMDEARKKLEEAKGAAEDQEEARRKLEQAKARLEEVLRQLREEEVERSLALLEARFRKMLQLETDVYEGTVRLDRVKPEDRSHNEEIEAGRLSRQQRTILDELTGAETLLREDGTSVAFPEAVQELREDMEQVAVRLAEAKVDQMTQLTEQDIMAALEEMIAAFQKARKENEEKQQQQQQQGGEQQDPPLVDAIAELKMIRALQMRVNKRTVNYSKLVDGEEGQAEKAELIEALEKLSQREERIYRTTRDIVLGKNQ
jgi:hypothetical protein